jgi:putative hydrolase of the HAD superfamily
MVDNGHQLPPTEELNDLLRDAVIATWDEAKKTLRIPSLGGVLCKLFGELGADVSQVEPEELLRIFGWAPRPGVILFPDTLSVLTELRNRGYKIGLLTNSFLPMWMRDIELQAYELMEFMDARVTAADVGYLKPHPAIYLHLLDLLQTSPDQAVFVGDRPRYDIAGANKAGITSVLINPPHLDRELHDVIPDFTITCLSELLPVLEELEEGVNER